MLLFTAACAGQSPSCACCLCTFASLLSDQGVLVWLAELLKDFSLAVADIQHRGASVTAEVQHDMLGVMLEYCTSKHLTRHNTTCQWLSSGWGQQ